MYYEEHEGPQRSSTTCPSSIPSVRRWAIVGRRPVGASLAQLSDLSQSVRLTLAYVQRFGARGCSGGRLGGGHGESACIPGQYNRLPRVYTAIANADPDCVHSQCLRDGLAKAKTRPRRSARAPRARGHVCASGEVPCSSRLSAAAPARIQAGGWVRPAMQGLARYSTPVC